MPELRIRAAVRSDASVLRRLAEFYQYDLLDVWPQQLNEHGEFGSVGIESHVRNPRLHAFLFLADEHPAGFALVSPDVCLEGNEHWMAQFFVMRPYRRLGLGRLAATTVFDRIRGRWEVGQMPGNQPALAFWRRVIGDYTQGRFTDCELNDERWHGTLQCFDNAAGS